MILKVFIWQPQTFKRHWYSSIYLTTPNLQQDIDIQSIYLTTPPKLSKRCWHSKYLFENTLKTSTRLWHSKYLLKNIPNLQQDFEIKIIIWKHPQTFKMLTFKVSVWNTYLKKPKPSTGLRYSSILLNPISPLPPPPPKEKTQTPSIWLTFNMLISKYTQNFIGTFSFMIYFSKNVANLWIPSEIKFSCSRFLFTASSIYLKDKDKSQILVFNKMLTFMVLFLKIYFIMSTKVSS